MFQYRLMIVLVTLLFLHPFTGQEQRQVTNFHYDGLSFSFPSDWTLNDESDADKQNLILMRGNDSLISVTAFRKLVLNQNEFEDSQMSLTEPYLQDLLRAFSLPNRKASRKGVCGDLALRKIAGTSIRGIYMGQPAVAEVFSFVLSGRFINLAYLRSEGASADNDSAWKLIRSTLTTFATNSTAQWPDFFIGKVHDVEVLNGRALSLPKPVYPAIAKVNHASGAVIVEITIDEKGSVLSAKAVTGHPLLKASAEEAARIAKFTPTKFCDQPVKVSGVLVYSFIAQ